MLPYSKVPSNAKLDVEPFKVHVEEAELQGFRTLLKLSPIGPPTYENTSSGGRYGLSREWLEVAKDTWLNKFDWRAYENRVNSYPSFKTWVNDAKGNSIRIQFLALFSHNPDATPIMFLHGWPGSNCEFMDILDLLRAKYSPETLPYHVIVPSIPGYGYSSPLPLDMDYTVELAASALDNLMKGLGFDKYVAQGGDLGSFISRRLASNSDACIGIHLNMMGVPPDGELPEDGRGDVKKATESLMTGFAFLGVQATKPATIGHVISSNPLALLSWIGEKYIEWTDETPKLQSILEIASLYWFTNTFARTLYHNRSLPAEAESESPQNPEDVELSMRLAPLRLPFIKKPCGYALFPREIIPIPHSWAERSCNLVLFTKHQAGGHFAALERPKDLLMSVEKYMDSMKRYYDEKDGRQV